MLLWRPTDFVMKVDTEDGLSRQNAARNKEPLDLSCRAPPPINCGFCIVVILDGSWSYIIAAADSVHFHNGADLDQEFR